MSQKSAPRGERRGQREGARPDTWPSSHIVPFPVYFQLRHFLRRSRFTSLSYLSVATFRPSVTSPFHRSSLKPSPRGTSRQWKAGNVPSVLSSLLSALLPSLRRETLTLSALRRSLTAAWRRSLKTKLEDEAWRRSEGTRVHGTFC